MLKPKKQVLLKPNRKETKMPNYLDKFKDFTINRNESFKININDIIVSVSCRNYADAIMNMADEKNGEIGTKLHDAFENGSKNPFEISPMNVPFFTFDNAEICIFETETTNSEGWHKEITDMFCDNVSVGVAPLHSALEFIEICNKVLEYSKRGA